MLPNIFMITHIYPVIELIRTTFVQLPPPIKIMNKMNHKMSFLVFDIQRISYRSIICARIPVFQRNSTCVTDSVFYNVWKFVRISTKYQEHRGSYNHFYVYNILLPKSYYKDKSQVFIRNYSCSTFCYCNYCP